VGEDKLPTAFLFCKNAMGFFSMAFFLPKGGNLVEQIEVFLYESKMLGNGTTCWLTPMRLQLHPGTGNQIP
jgi:hypothetical protein